MENFQKIDSLLTRAKHKTLLTIFPHPDDETMASGGLLMRAKELGFKTVAVVLTEGAAGQMHIHPNGKTVKQIRRTELERAVKILGVDELVVGEFDDGKLREQKDEWMKWVRKTIAKHDPGVVVTYDHTGFTGHPDHIALSLGIDEIPGDFILLWPSIIEELKARIVHAKLRDLTVSPTHCLDLGWRFIRKWRAASAHRSQRLGKDLPVPLWLALGMYHFEWYHEVERGLKYPYKFVEFKI